MTRHERRGSAKNRRRVRSERTTDRMRMDLSGDARDLALRHAVAEVLTVGG
jgi:hypothetical protein